MNLITLTAPPDTLLQEKLQLFETLFTYPLTDSVTFRIDHGGDYTAFFSAMGESVCWVVCEEENVIATMSVAFRTLQTEQQKLRIAYVGDLKVHPSFRHNFALYRLLRTAQTDIEKRTCLAYGVVMSSTARTPDQYTGRIGVPHFQPLSRRYLLRFDTQYGCAHEIHVCSEKMGRALYYSLCEVHLNFTQTRTRSEMPLQWMYDQNQACGMLEDTRRVKRLYTGDKELISSHLSYFSYTVPMHGAHVIKSALTYTKDKNIPALFVALTREQYEALTDHLSDTVYTVSEATVYGTHPCLRDVPITSADI